MQILPYPHPLPPPPHFRYTLNVSINKIRRLVPALLLAALTCLTFVTPAFALDIDPADYFRLTYEPITFDKGRVAPGETFRTTIKGLASCDKTIPLPVSRATVTSRVIARQAATGASYTLNPGFVIDIDPFPDRQGETFAIDVPLELRFPPGATPGDYQVVWQPIEARARVSFIWTDITDYFPAEQAMGEVTVETAAPAPPGANPSAPTVPATPTTPTTTGFAVPWWVLPLAGVILVLAIIGTVLFLALRRRE
jgi:hypothetical protein